jgi:hypothetical protein
MMLFHSLSLGRRHGRFICPTFLSARLPLVRGQRNLHFLSVARHRHLANGRDHVLTIARVVRFHEEILDARQRVVDIHAGIEGVRPKSDIEWLYMQRTNGVARIWWWQFKACDSSHDSCTIAMQQATYLDGKSLSMRRREQGKTMSLELKQFAAARELGVNLVCTHKAIPMRKLSKCDSRCHTCITSEHLFSVIHSTLLPRPMLGLILYVPPPWQCSLPRSMSASRKRVRAQPSCTGGAMAVFQKRRRLTLDEHALADLDDFWGKELVARLCIRDRVRLRRVNKRFYARDATLVIPKEFALYFKDGSRWWQRGSNPLYSFQDPTKIAIYRHLELTLGWHVLGWPCSISVSYCSDILVAVEKRGLAWYKKYAWPDGRSTDNMYWRICCWATHFELSGPWANFPMHYAESSDILRIYTLTPLTNRAHRETLVDLLTCDAISLKLVQLYLGDGMTRTEASRRRRSDSL